VLLRSIVVAGARHTRTSFVQNIADDTFTLGEPVTTDRLERLRDDLYDLGVFRGVTLELTPKDDPARDLVVTLAERGRYELEGKFGASTDQGIRVSGRATRYHLWGLAHRLDLLGQIGFDWLTEDISSWVPDFTDPEWRLAATYTAPRFPLARQDFVLDLVIREVENERTWQMDRTGGGVAIVTRVGRRMEVRIGPRLELRRLEEVDTAVLLEGEPWADLVGLEEPALPSPWRVQDALVGQWLFDLRDDPIVPREGAFLAANAEWAPGIPWDADLPRTAFLKGDARISGYVPLRPLTLHLGVAGGYVASMNDLLVPLEDRFRLGGTASLRGYVRDGVGPHNQAERVDVAWPTALRPAIEYAFADDPNRWAPTGGDTMASGIVQLVIPFTALGLVGWDSTSASVFADMGNVWFLDPTALPTTDLEVTDALIPNVRVGVGAGFQMLTPVGPLSMDFAFNPQRIAASGQQLRFLRDELEEPTLRVHITLGSPF
jgi:outer membrane protein assembly factor BamA